MTDKIVGQLAKLLPLLPFYPRWAQMLFMSMLLGLGLLVFAGILYYPAAKKLKDGQVPDNALPELIEKARAAGQSYVIESVSELVELRSAVSDPGPLDGTFGAAIVSITYTVFALAEVKKFNEGFHTMTDGAEVAHLPGGGDECCSGEAGSKTQSEWDVNVDIPAGTRGTVTTRALWKFTKPLQSGRTVHDFSNLSETEDAFCYPNHEDVIGELTITVVGQRQFRAPREGDALRKTPASMGAGDNLERGTPIVRIPLGNEVPIEHAISARWEEVLPGQTVGIRVGSMSGHLYE